MNPFKGPWRLLARAAGAVEDVLIVLLLGFMILLAGFQIILRDVFDTGLGWSDPLLRIMVLWIGLLGAMAATRDDNQITIDVLSRFLPPQARVYTRLVTDLFTAGICGLLAYHGGRLVLMDKADGVLAFGAMPAWIFELIIPFGFGVIALRYVSYLPRRMREQRETSL